MHIAMFGASGAGKSTATALLVQELSGDGLNVQVVKIAEPLYQIQRLVYTMAGAPTADPYLQDGALLRVLGETFRRISPDFLTCDFAKRTAEASRSKFAVVICDDMRAPDFPALQSLDFFLVRVTASEHIRTRRRELRGDTTPVLDTHAAEQPIETRPDFTIHNDGSIEDLQLQIRLLCVSLREARLSRDWTA